MAARNEKIEVYLSATNGSWYWRYRARNGRIMADGAEGYLEARYAVKGAMKVLNLPDATWLAPGGGTHQWTAEDSRGRGFIELVVVRR